MNMLPFKVEMFVFYKECYHHEMDRKDKIRQQLGLAIAVLALLGNWGSYYLSNFKLTGFLWMHVVFYLPFLTGVIAGLIAFYYLFRYFFIKDPYAYIPSTEAISDAIHQFIQSSPKKDEDGTRAFFIENLSQQYSKFATTNRKNNIARTGYVFLSLKYSMISTVLFMATFPGFYCFKDESVLLNPKHAEVSTMNRQQTDPENTSNGDSNASSEHPSQGEVPSEVNHDSTQNQVEWPRGDYIKEAEEKDVD